MLTLAVDTTGEFGSIALADGEGVREEILLHEPNGFSGVIFGQIESLLTRQGVALGDVELFAGASGPGSFTGVRVGLAAMKGLGEMLGRPVAGVSNLEALAEFGTAEFRATVIDARRGEVYAALYGPDGAVIPEQVAAFPEIVRQMEERLRGPGECEWVCCDFAPFSGALAGTPFESLPVVRAPRALAGAIARIAMRQPLMGAEAIEANYVRRSDAELLWKPA